jgi:hypothetical protein
MSDLHIYSVLNIRLQTEHLEAELGFYPVRLYSQQNGRPSREVTDTIEVYYYYPSGGTIRDRNMNILFYEPKLDKYHSPNR